MLNGVNYSGGGSHTYSETEQVVGKWIDGSTLYERSINLGSFSLPGGGTRTIATITGIDKFLCYNGYGVDGVEKYTIPDFGARIKIVNDNIIFQCASNSAWSISEGYVTIRYTKTTATRSLSAPVTSQKAQIEPLTTKDEEVPTEEENIVYDKEQEQ